MASKLTTIAPSAATLSKVKTNTGTSKTASSKSGFTPIDGTAVDPVRSFKETIGLGENEEGETLVCFALNQGPGSSTQIVKCSEFVDNSLIDAVREVVENGVPDKNQHVSAADMFLSTVHLNDEGLIQFRLGQGARSVKLNAVDLSRWLNALIEVQPKLAARMKG
jgi:hypothetical protein